MCVSSELIFPGFPLRVMEKPVTHVFSRNSSGVLLDAVEIAEEGDNIPVPEFPTEALPAVFIVGMLGVILFLQRTKEN
jgi:hypothetical protein